MPLEIIRNDITRMQVDAIVNAANQSLMGGGGVDGAIHQAAGPGLLEECRKLHGCDTGEAKITQGYLLPCRYVIHTVGPIWRGGGYQEKEKLISCYRNSLLLAWKHEIKTIAFPLISAGAYGYPKAQALLVAVDTIREFLLDHDMLVYLVLFGKESWKISEKLYAGLAQYIDDRYVEEHLDYARENQRRIRCQANNQEELCAPCPAPPMASSLDEALSGMDESFSQMVLRKIDEKGMTDAQCYKSAHMDRKLFSKIRKDAYYRPSKPTALSLAVALRLSLPETEELLRKAGLALSHSNKGDIIVEYCILHGVYDLFEINELLYHYDQALLGN